MQQQLISGDSDGGGENIDTWTHTQIYMCTSTPTSTNTYTHKQTTDLFLLLNLLTRFCSQGSSFNRKRLAKLPRTGAEPGNMSLLSRLLTTSALLRQWYFCQTKFSNSCSVWNIVSTSIELARFRDMTKYSFIKWACISGTLSQIVIPCFQGVLDMITDHWKWGFWLYYVKKVSHIMIINKYSVKYFPYS